MHRRAGPRIKLDVVRWQEDTWAGVLNLGHVAQTYSTVWQRLKCIATSDGTFVNPVDMVVTDPRKSTMSAYPGCQAKIRVAVGYVVI